MKITAKDGLLYKDGFLLGLPEADLVARDHGFPFAEQLVRHLEQVARTKDNRTLPVVLVTPPDQ